jgi:hypothetical protein
MAYKVFWKGHGYKIIGKYMFSEQELQSGLKRKKKYQQWTNKKKR